MKLRYRTIQGGQPVFVLVGDGGQVVWHGSRRDKAIRLLWAAGADIPECLRQPSGEFEVELRWTAHAPL
jgi:hypothetical protein